MTPDIDAGFAQIARQRIAHAPLRYYVWLPIKRAIALWFVPHAQYYPFEGELFPLEEMDHENYQDFWLPIFFLLTWTYTIVGVAGACFLWKTDRIARRDAIRWLLLAAFLILPRWIYMATLEHTEPRYVVEFFPFLSVLGGIAISCCFGAHQTSTLGIGRCEAPRGDQRRTTSPWISNKGRSVISALMMAWTSKKSQQFASYSIILRRAESFRSCLFKSLSGIEKSFQAIRCRSRFSLRLLL
jgi:hypothetical protein